MRELDQEELNEVAGGEVECTGFLWYIVTGGSVNCWQK